MVDRERSNKLRVDLYRLLFPEIQRQDQQSGAHGPVLHWDDPDAHWDALEQDPRNPASLDAVWDKVGLAPLYQDLFHVIETLEGEDLEVLESLDAIIDPLRCPEEVLPHLAASLGYRLVEGLPLEAKRNAVYGLVSAFKSRGTWVSFKVFYRLMGFEVINVFPLWKKNVEEALGDYSRTRFTTTPIASAPIGPAGQAAYVGQLADSPIEPGSLRFRDTGLNGITVRDDEEGNLLGPDGNCGTIDYRTGAYRLLLPSNAVGAVVADLNKVTAEWPYHAARIDLEVLLSPAGGEVPEVTEAVIAEMFARLEEVRPIHVKLRALALVVELRDTFGEDGVSGATDKTGCASTVKDVRTGQPFPGDPGRDYTYTLDAGPSGDDDLTVEQIDPGTGNTTVLDKNHEESVEIVCPLDTLKIEFSDGSPTVWS